MNELRDPVEASAIKSRDDRFHCSPLHVVLRADACARRQAMVRAGMHQIQMATCINCPLGAIVERNSGGPIPISEVARKAHAKKGGGAALKNIPAFDDSMGASKYRRATRKLKVLKGGLREEEKATLPTFGAELALPKAPPGKSAPSFPEYAEYPTKTAVAARVVHVNPEVRAGGVAGAIIRSTELGLMVERPGFEPAGPFPDEETAARVAGSIDAQGESLAPALSPAPVEQGEKPMAGRKWSEETKAKFKATMAARKKERQAEPAPVKRGKPGPKPRKKAASARVGDTAITATFEQFKLGLEALELVQKVGWDVVRSIAARLDEVRA